MIYTDYYDGELHVFCKCDNCKQNRKITRVRNNITLYKDYWKLLLKNKDVKDIYDIKNNRYYCSKCCEQLFNKGFKNNDIKKYFNTISEIRNIDEQIINLVNILSVLETYNIKDIKNKLNDYIKKENKLKNIIKGIENEKVKTEENFRNSTEVV